jgi:hypothetical protein
MMPDDVAVELAPSVIGLVHSAIFHTLRVDTAHASTTCTAAQDADVVAIP